MRLGSSSAATGQIGRADLLRLLATAPRPCLVLDDDGDNQFAYQENKPIGQSQTGGRQVDWVAPSSAEQTSNFKLPLQMPFVHIVADRNMRELPKQQQNSTQTDIIYEPISEEDAKPPAECRLINYQDLVPKARLLPTLKRYLSSNRRAGLDVSLLVKQIAKQQLPRHLPRRQLKSWHPQWVVVLDFSKRLQPYRQDMHQLAEELLRACGQAGVSIRIINHGPLQHWTDWVVEQQSRGPLPSKNAWRMPVADTPILLVSDLGLLEGSESNVHQAWQTFIRQLSNAQTKPLALLPLASEQLDVGLPNSLTLLRWSPDARIHPERALGKGQAVPDGLADLLAMAAVTRRVDPPLLREMRRLNPKSPFNAGLEGAFWCHADVEAGSAANIRQQAQAKHLAHYAQHLVDDHIKLEQLRYCHHAHLRAVLNHEETLLWGAHVKQNGTKPTAAIQQRLAKAETFMHQLAATLTQPNGLQKGGIWWHVAQDIVQRAGHTMGEQYSDLLAPLVLAIAEVRGTWLQLPDWVDPAHLAGDDTNASHCWLVRDPATGSVVLQPTPPAQNQSVLTEALPIDRGGLRIQSANSRMLLTFQDLPYRVCGLQDEALIKLTTSQETLTLASVKRPRGAIAWGYDSARPELRVKSAALCGQSFEWSTRPIPIEPTLQTVLAENGQYLLLENPLSKQAAPYDISTSNQIGDNVENFTTRVSFVLDEYGVRANLNLILPAGELMQSMRWIEAGKFIMGSPDVEPERLGKEGPCHEVTISQGFWLADTACTQALWQALMGNNPSFFTDARNLPVEQITWHAVQEFLRKLEKSLPGCQLDLPSEAEWEYACRAGSHTPFSFGANINPQQVNYDGDIPYPGGEQGKYLEKSVAVKSLPANPWGLYEMHGNVWEWCKDGKRAYSGQAQVDPLGQVLGDEPRSVRGGSWYDYARRARSAYRLAHQPGIAIYDLGFRFCLRSIESGQVPVSPAGSPGKASGASQDADLKGAKTNEYISDERKFPIS
ncbi:MAG: formylglycine-generating enzyme family protein [Methylococcaceae bacterium]|jgi:formylglycine-generating enzyme required for sulfatase activity